MKVLIPILAFVIIGFFVWLVVSIITDDDENDEGPPSYSKGLDEHGFP
jgi:large-conductance mechanosensitive channel